VIVDGSASRVQTGSSGLACDEITAFRWDVLVHDAPDPTHVEYLLDPADSGSWTPFPCGLQTDSSTLTLRFTDDGEYVVRLCVMDDEGTEDCTETETIQILNRPPQAWLAASPLDGFQGDPVSFVATSSDADGTIRTYRFEFGDGSPVRQSSTAAQTHVYTAKGEYEVCLEVSDDDGAVSSRDCVRISVGNRGPVARLSVSARTVQVGETVLFTDRSTDQDPAPLGGITVMGLDFGDGDRLLAGSPIRGEGYAHSYSAPGTYEVTLSVYDTDNAYDATSVTITVE
jgi:PKD repeat protein